jgi:hypothetical protein
MVVSADDKTIKKEIFIVTMKGCKQTATQSDIDRVAKELKLDTKTNWSFEEANLLAKRLWVPKQQNQKKLTQEEKDRE